MEDRLLEYRRKKKREQQIQLVKSKLSKLFNFAFIMREKPKDEDDVRIEIKPPKQTQSDNESLLSERLSDTTESLDPLEAEDDTENAAEVDDSSKCLKYTLRGVYFLFWVTLYIIAIELQFGIVFLILSALIGIYLNTRTGPKKRNEPSAYSVFNKDFVAIDGTLKAEHLERTFGYGTR